MVITNRKIQVTREMMFKEGLVSKSNYGIPASPTEKGRIKWRPMWEMETKDFEAIEAYFLTLKEKIG